MKDEKKSMLPPMGFEMLYTCIYPHLGNFLVSDLQKSHYEVGILGALLQGGEFSSQRSLSKLFGISRPRITIYLDNMEKAGLITRVADEKDKRSNNIIVTQKGKDVLAWQWDRKKRYQKIMNEGITDEELQLHSKITMKMIDNVLGVSERQLMSMPSFENFSRNDDLDIPQIMSEKYQKAFISMEKRVDNVKKKKMKVE